MGKGWVWEVPVPSPSPFTYTPSPCCYERYHSSIGSQITSDKWLDGHFVALKDCKTGHMY